MKRLIKSSDDIFGMANINPKKSGIASQIWSDGQGINRNKPDATPRVKICVNDDEISVSISDHPEVLAPKNWQKIYKHDVIQKLEEGIAYVSRNYDIFWKHYNDTDGSFDDEDLFNALRSRGDYS